MGFLGKVNASKSNYGLFINEKNASYVCSLWQGDNYHEYIESKDFPSYEEAVEAALKYILENLI